MLRKPTHLRRVAAHDVPTYTDAHCPMIMPAPRCQHAVPLAGARASATSHRSHQQPRSAHRARPAAAQYPATRKTSATDRSKRQPAINQNTATMLRHNPTHPVIQSVATAGQAARHRREGVARSVPRAPASAVQVHRTRIACSTPHAHRSV